MHANASILSLFFYPFSSTVSLGGKRRTDEENIGLLRTLTRFIRVHGTSTIHISTGSNIDYVPRSDSECKTP